MNDDTAKDEQETDLLAQIESARATAAQAAKSGTRENIFYSVTLLNHLTLQLRVLRLERRQETLEGLLREGLHERLFELRKELAEQEGRDFGSDA